LRKINPEQKERKKKISFVMAEREKNIAKITMRIIYIGRKTFNLLQKIY
jgi:hypothetical protein